MYGFSYVGYEYDDVAVAGVWRARPWPTCKRHGAMARAVTLPLSAAARLRGYIDTGIKDY